MIFQILDFCPLVRLVHLHWGFKLCLDRNDLVYRQNENRPMLMFYRGIVSRFEERGYVHG